MKTANLSKMKIAHYTGNRKKNELILSAGGAVRITTISGSGRHASYYTCQYPDVVAGYDLVFCNDSPRGGRLGDYVAATKSGDKTIERAAFVRNFRNSWRKKLAIVAANSPAAITEAVKKAVHIITPIDDKDGRYWLNGYCGCGTYRLVIVDGIIVATLKGGYHQSCPYMVDVNMWVDAVKRYIYDIFGDNCSVVKADGSGTHFYLRNDDDRALIKTTNYYVPSTYSPSLHLNMEICPA